jgi:CheY-like chemotaxis protein
MASRVLLVEDDVLIRMMIADMVEELGHRVVGEAGDITQATAMARSAQFDIAILDINLKGKESYPVADIIRSRGIPFVFASGYADVPADYRAAPSLKKPFQIEHLAKAIDTAGIANLGRA